MDLSEILPEKGQCFQNSLAFGLSFRKNNYCIKRTLDDYFVNMNGNVECLKAKYFSIFNIANFPQENLFETIKFLEKKINISIVIFKNMFEDKKHMEIIYQESNFKVIPIYFFYDFESDISIQGHISFLFDLCLKQKCPQNKTCYYCLKDIKYSNYNKHTCIFDRCKKCDRYLLKCNDIVIDLEYCSKDDDLLTNLKCQDCNFFFASISCFDKHKKNNCKKDINCDTKFCRNCCIFHLPTSPCFMRPLTKFKNVNNENFILFLQIIDGLLFCSILCSIDDFLDGKIRCYIPEHGKYSGIFPQIYDKEDILMNRINDCDSNFDNSNSYIFKSIIKFLLNAGKVNVFTFQESIEYVLTEIQDEHLINFQESCITFKNISFISIEKFFSIPDCILAIKLNEIGILMHLPENIVKKILINEKIYYFDKNDFKTSEIYAGNCRSDHEKLLSEIEYIEDILPVKCKTTALAYNICLYKCYVYCKAFHSMKSIFFKIGEEIKIIQNNNNMNVTKNDFDIFAYKSLSNMSFSLFKSLLNEKQFICLPSVAKKKSFGTSKSELAFVMFLSKIHRYICKVIPFSIIDGSGEQYRVKQHSLGNIR